MTYITSKRVKGRTMGVDMDMGVNCELILYADDCIIQVSRKDPKVIQKKRGNRACTSKQLVD